jgi:hypothetical protein
MVRHILGLGALAGLALLAAASTATADAIAFTGNVANDFSSSNPNVVTIPVSNDPNSIGVASWMESQGLISGWAVKDIRLDYNAATDQLFVGVNTWGIAGDADGKGNPGTPDSQLAAVGGVNPAHLGGLDSITIGFAPNGTPGSKTYGTPVAVAGVPAEVLVNGVPVANKQVPGTSIDGFTIASYANNKLALQYNYGTQLTNNMGGLAFDPSAGHPNFEFTINNFSKLPGLNPLQGFWISAYAGSPDDVVAGEASLAWTRIAQIQPQAVPEPASVLAWTLAVALAAWQFRRRLMPAVD